MADEGRVVGDPTEVLTRSGGAYVSLTTSGEPADSGGSATAASGVTTSAPAAAAVPPAAPAPSAEPEPPRGLHAFPYVGWIALLLAAATVFATASGVGLVSDRDFEGAAGAAWVAIVLSALAVLGGILAIVLRSARTAGIVAIVVGVLANPVLLARLLDVVGAAVG